MRIQTTLNGKALQIRLSPSAERALAARNKPLLAEMELYFSCLIRKQVRFHETPTNADTVAANKNLHVRFHPVMSQACSIKDNPEGPPLSDFPIVSGERFSPRWLEIGFINGEWQGDFGY